VTDEIAGKPVPRPTEETRDYWEGCRRGELRLQRCSECRRVQFPPRRFCSSCLCARLESFAALGRGVIRSYSVVRHPLSPAFAGDVPYLVALIQLAEGPTMMAGLRGCTPDTVAVGMAVEVEFEARSETHVPYFHPA